MTLASHPIASVPIAWTDPPPPPTVPMAIANPGVVDVVYLVELYPFAPPES